MAFKVRRVDYFHTTVRDVPGAAYEVLATLDDLGVGMLAFTVVPTGAAQAQLTIFPEDSQRFQAEARKAALRLDGPYQAFMAQGDESLSAIAALHEKLYQANVNVYASSGTSEGNGSFGYVLYVRPEQYEQAAKALGL